MQVSFKPSPTLGSEPVPLAACGPLCTRVLDKGASSHRPTGRRSFGASGPGPHSPGGETWAHRRREAGPGMRGPEVSQGGSCGAGVNRTLAAPEAPITSHHLRLQRFIPCSRLSVAGQISS